MMQCERIFIIFYLLCASFFFFSFSLVSPVTLLGHYQEVTLPTKEPVLYWPYCLLFFCFRCLFPSHIDVQGRWGQSGASLETDGHPFRGLAEGAASLARECLW